MKRGAVLMKALFIAMIAVVSVYAAYRYLGHAAKRRAVQAVGAFVDMSVGAMEEVSGRYEDVNYVLTTMLRKKRLLSGCAMGRLR